MKNYFNPRSYKRSDTILVDALACALISIHAPTRGATTGQYGYANWKNDFNPRSYKRSDMPTVHSQPFMSDFNPRSYKRSDIY